MECLFIIMKFAAAANIHEKLFNKSFARSSQMVRNKLCWEANKIVELPKQRNTYQSSSTPHQVYKSTLIFYVFCSAKVTTLQ